MTKAATENRRGMRLKAVTWMDDDAIVKEVIRKQFAEMEEQINNLKHCKYGRGTNVFKMREHVCGSKKALQEAHTVKNVKTGEHAEANDRIREVRSPTGPGTMILQRGRICRMVL